MKTIARVLCATILLGCLALAQEGQQQFGSLGDFKLVSGEVIRDCRIGYRTFGQLNADRSNVILFPTWFGGTTQGVANSIGPGKLADSSKYYVIAVDALGDGVSTSPSNSTAQPRMKFPKITIKDMVNSQHQLLTQVLHINHLKAVMGISMGGMQTFQWIVSYPEFMDRAIPVVGSPRLAPYDLLLWQSGIDAITTDPAWNKGDYQDNPAKALRSEIMNLALSTPERYNQQTTRAQVAPSIEQAKKDPAFDANGFVRQAEAMMSLDVSDAFGGSMEKAAAAVKAKVLVIAALQDHMVTPGPALDFAPLIHAEVLKLESNCGHLAPGCETKTVVPAVAAFLEK